MKEKIKSNFLLTIPKRIIKKFELKTGNAVEVTIKKNLQRVSFITFVQKPNRIIIRSIAKEKLNIREGEEIEFKIKRLKEITRTNKIIKGNKIDVLSLIPEKTKGGFPMRIFENKNKILILDDIPRGHPSEPVIINRFLSPNFCKFLGLFQAEGEKIINRAGGTAFTFTNILPSLHKIIFEGLLELGVSDEIIKLRVLVPESVDKNTQTISIENFLKLTNINVEKIRINKIKEKKTVFDTGKSKFKEFTIRNIAFTVKVERTLLVEIAINAIYKIREFLSKLEEFNDITHFMACNFLGGVIMGDGTVGIGKGRKNRTKIHMEIKDPDIKHLEECEKIFNSLGFGTSLKKNEILPRLVVYCNWKLLVQIVFRNGMLKENPFHLIKLLLVIRKMKQWKKYSRFMFINGTENTTKLRGTWKLTRQGTRLWLRQKEKEGLIEGIKNGTVLEWVLTEKGREIQKLLKEIELLNSSLIGIVRIDNFDETRKFLKDFNKSRIGDKLQLYKFST